MFYVSCDGCFSFLPHMSQPTSDQRTLQQLRDLFHVRCDNCSLRNTTIVCLCVCVCGYCDLFSMNIFRFEAVLIRRRLILHVFIFSFAKITLHFPISIAILTEYINSKSTNDAADFHGDNQTLQWKLYKLLDDFFYLIDFHQKKLHSQKRNHRTLSWKIENRLGNDWLTHCHHKHVLFITFYLFDVNDIVHLMCD